MNSIKFLIAGLLFCALQGQVELFKFAKYAGPPPPSRPPPPPPPPQPEQERLYAPLWLAPQQPSLLPLPPANYQPEPLYQQQEQSGTKGGQRLEADRLSEATKGAPLPLAPLRQQQPALLQSQPLSYLIVRPVQSFSPYFEPQYHNYQRQFTRPAYLREENSNSGSTKGGSKQLREEQQQEQQAEDQQTKEPIEQQEHIDEQQPQPQPPPPAIVYPIHPAKESKLRAMLEKIKAKFTLGSSYQVVGEEYVQPIPPPQPMPARPQPQQPVEQQQIQEQIPEQQRDLGFQEELPKQQPIQEQQQMEQLPQQQIRQEEEKGSKSVILFKQEESKGKRLPEKQTTVQQQQQELPLAQEPIRQNEVSKGQLNNNSGF